MIRTFRNMRLGLKLMFIIIAALVINQGISYARLSSLAADLLEETGRDQLDSETAAIQVSMAQAEAQTLSNAKLLANSPGLIDAVMTRDLNIVRTIVLTTAAAATFDKIDVVDASGQSLLPPAARAASAAGSEDMLRLGLLGIETTGVVADARASTPVLSAVTPLRDTQGALVGALVAVLVLVALERRRTIPFLGTAVMGIVVLFLAVAQVNFFVPADGVQPALQSYWLVIHVGVAVIATGVFTVGFVTSVLQLLRAGRARGGALASPRWGWLATTPGVGALESLAFRLNAVGFVLWSFTLVAGAIWAEHAWGRYWGWDPKEVWTFVIWVVYAGYLHARTTRGWAGARAAWLVVVAYVCVIINFTLVNLLFPGLHTYAT